MEGRVSNFGHGGKTYCWNEHYIILETVSMTILMRLRVFLQRAYGSDSSGQDVLREAANEFSMQPACAARSLLDNGAPGVHCSQLHERIVFQAVFAKAVSNRFHHPQLQSARGAGRGQDGFQPAADDCRVSVRAKASTRARWRPGWMPDSQLFLFELDPAFSRDLERQFADDPRVHVINRDAASLSEELHRRGIAQCDYILSGIPFSILEIKKKRALLQETYDALAARRRFIIYQVTNELRQHATFFDRAESEYCPAEYSADVHHRFPKGADAERPCADPRQRRSQDLVSAHGMSARKTRIEKDSMGEMSVPESALYGASTQRAVLNFPVSGWRFSRPFIRALGLLKWAAAQANHDLGLLDAERSALIVQAAEEVVEGKLDEHFPLDIFQTGSGTSTNTNANEVIANRCCQLAGKADRRARAGSP